MLSMKGQITMFISRRLNALVVVLLAALAANANGETITRKILTVNDTAEQEFAGNHDLGFVRKGSSDLELGMEGAGGYTREIDIPQRIALIYRDIDIPAGATINSARIQFMVDEPDKTIWFPENDPEFGELMPLEASVSIYGYLHPNSPDLPPASACDPFGNCVNAWALTNLTGGTSQPLTGVGSNIANVTAPVHWDNIPTWSTGPPDFASINGTAGPEQLSPELASIVQEIVDLPEWAPNNSMTFFIDPKVIGTDPDTSEDLFARGNRNAINFCTPSESRCVGANAPEAPVLMIDFSTGATPDVDFNGDGMIDAADYTAWRDDLGMPYTPADYDAWKAAYGTSPGLGAAQGTAVPEPGSLLLLVGFAAAVVLSQTRMIG
jgi:hypothetical protein